MVKDIKDVVTWLKSWFYDKSEVYAKNETYTKTEVNTALGNKLNSNLTTANKMLVTDTNGNVVLDDLPSFGGAIEIVTTLPTAGSDTMGKLYIISENSKVNVYYTKNNNGSYSWHKMDTDILDELSIAWSDITGKPSSFTPSSHSHSINDVNTLQTTLDGKAPTDHSSSATTYGVGTISNYGHNKVINDLNHSYFGNGESLSAFQGYVLRNAINGKQDVGDCITSIALVPKGSDPTADAYNGVIRLYYGDEP